MLVTPVRSYAQLKGIKVMFGERTNEKKINKTAQPTVLAKSMTFVGDMFCSGDIKIDGQVTGDIETKGRVIIGKYGKVIGSIRSTSILVMGGFEGRIECAGVLSLKEAAVVKGEILYDRIEIEHGVALEGQLCRLDLNAFKEVHNAKSEALLAQKDQKNSFKVIKSGDRRPVSKNKVEKEQDGNTEQMGWV